LSAESGDVHGKIAEHQQLVSSNQAKAPKDARPAPASGPAVNPARDRNLPMLEIDVPPLEVERLIEPHPGAHQQGYDVAEFRRARDRGSQHKQRNNEREGDNETGHHALAGPLTDERGARCSPRNQIERLLQTRR